MRFTPPLRARRRMAGLVMPWMLSRSTFRWRFAPPLPRPFPPLPRPDIVDASSLSRELLRLAWLGLLVEATTLRLDQAAVLDGRQKRGYFKVVVLVAELGVDKIIDLATLTGACIVALGPSIAGIFTPSDELAQEVTAASELSGEKFWRLPMEESYSEQMKSRG
ncbi:hypothetical protein ZWY2020_001579 [Hordeum vulgare]|nr:hypothetical protein ZWY2020_001579 [Hordeum vulgare]